MEQDKNLMEKVTCVSTGELKTPMKGANKRNKKDIVHAIVSYINSACTALMTGRRTEQSMMNCRRYYISSEKASVTSLFTTGFG